MGPSQPGCPESERHRQDQDRRRDEREQVSNGFMIHLDRAGGGGSDSVDACGLRYGSVSGTPGYRDPGVEPARGPWG
ncbi:MAG: hypothetical protein CMJ83_20900 [Planctomycetes bacterium]|nr:hypothetical protein [Planctomycetota bacterium]